MKKFLLSLLSLMAAIGVFAQKTKKVSAEYTLIAPETTSIEKAKHIAVEKAKVDAIEKAFGSHVSQINVTKIENLNGKSTINFSSSGGSEVKGEWIEFLTEPHYDITYADNMLNVSVSFKGMVREITTQRTAIDATIMRNGVGKQFEDNDFYSGDEMYLSFTSPVQGYLLAYLVDGDNAYRLLPYRREKTPHVKIETTDPILFFDKKSVAPSKRKLTDEYVLTASQPLEINTIYIIFSPNYISKAIDTVDGKGTPHSLGASEFHKWLSSARRQDYNLVVKEIPITIQQKE